MATVPGIDVSYWNSGIDWNKVRSTGQRFVFVKATEGDYYTDPTFDDNWIGAKSAGLLRGAYHFFRANVDGKKQAKKYIDYVRSLNDAAELPPALDIETHDGQTNDRLISRAKVWLDEVANAFGKKPIIYSGQYFLQDHFSEAGGGPPMWAKDYPLWVAQYPNTYAEGQLPGLPRGWFKWTFWQYSEKGRVNGINENVDLNVFNGSLNDLYVFAGLQTAPQPASSTTTHTINDGETFSTIAAKYGVGVIDLISANPQLLKVGESLKIPVSAPVETGAGSSPASGGGTQPAPARTHTVAAGDTLYGIAIKYSTTVAAIASANNITNPNQIRVGQIIIIP